MAVHDFRELRVYQHAFTAAQRLFDLTKAFPAQEQYSLTDQVRRASRSVCANIGEAWRKRRYKAAFVSKLSDADSEAAEVIVWLEFAKKCGYMKSTDYEELTDQYDHICAQLCKMMGEADKWCGRSRSTPPASRSSIGFSLVELIVVVAIVALLVSLLAPAVGRARDEAELVKCRATLKSLGLALSLYAQNNNENYPVTERLHNPQLKLLQLTADYVRQPELFYCPANTEPNETYSQANVAAGNIGYFYLCCEERPTNPDTAAFLRRSVAWPRYLSRNSAPGTWLACDIWYSAAPTAHSWYKKGVNYLTSDQAVGFVPESIRSSFK